MGVYRRSYRIHERELLRHHLGVKAEEVGPIVVVAVLLQQSEGAGAVIKHWGEENINIAAAH